MYSFTCATYICRTVEERAVFMNITESISMDCHLLQCKLKSLAIRALNQWLSCWYVWFSKRFFQDVILTVINVWKIPAHQMKVSVTEFKQASQFRYTCMHPLPMLLDLPSGMKWQTKGSDLFKFTNLHFPLRLNMEINWKMWDFFILFCIWMCFTNMKIMSPNPIWQHLFLYVWNIQRTVEASEGFLV